MQDDKFTNQDLLAILGIYVLYEGSKTINDETWAEFNRELLHGHRFFPRENSIINTIKEKANCATMYYKTGKILYRARIFNGDPYSSYMELYRDELGISKEQWNTEKAKFFQNKQLFLTQLSMMDYVDKDYFEANPDAKPMLNALIKWRKLDFKGYDSQQSLPPPPEFFSEGRANPAGIRYTYLCEDEITPVYEVRPTINQIVSVAQFQLSKQLKIYDINYATEKLELPPLFSIISEKFSTPYNGNPMEYLPTQYLTEFIRTMGFDGIRFNSSLHKNGKNVVLFDMDYKVISSKLVTVKKYNLETEDHDIYSLLNQRR